MVDFKALVEETTTKETVICNDIRKLENKHDNIIFWTLIISLLFILVGVGI